MSKYSNRLSVVLNLRLILVWGLSFGLGASLGNLFGQMFRNYDSWVVDIPSTLVGFYIGGLVAGWYLYRTLKERLDLPAIPGWKTFAFFWNLALLVANLGTWLFFVYLDTL